MSSCCNTSKPLIPGIYIQKHQVRRFVLDKLQRFAAIFSLANYFDI